MTVPEPLTQAERAELERLRARCSMLEQRAGHLMVDADRRERAALDRAADCTEHGREIRHLRHLASWYWAIDEHSDAARRAIVAALGNWRIALGDRATPVPAAELRAALDGIIAAQQKVMRRPAGYPTLADCLRAGGCDHDSLSGPVKAEIAEVLGLTAPAGA
ncbi:MAG: hypothetical protein M0030_11470 [Actinomycetota bacterium]|nr:hypothetical protein [Actinomycetota bacterium]